MINNNYTHKIGKKIIDVIFSHLDINHCNLCVKSVYSHIEIYKEVLDMFYEDLDENSFLFDGFYETEYFSESEVFLFLKSAKIENFVIESKNEFILENKYMIKIQCDLSQYHGRETDYIEEIRHNPILSYEMFILFFFIIIKLPKEEAELKNIKRRLNNSIDIDAKKIIIKKEYEKHNEKLSRNKLIKMIENHFRIEIDYLNYFNLNNIDFINNLFELGYGMEMFYIDFVSPYDPHDFCDETNEVGSYSILDEYSFYNDKEILYNDKETVNFEKFKIFRWLLEIYDHLKILDFLKNYNTIIENEKTKENSTSDNKQKPFHSFFKPEFLQKNGKDKEKLNNLKNIFINENDNKAFAVYIYYFKKEIFIENFKIDPFIKGLISTNNAKVKSTKSIEYHLRKFNKGIENQNFYFKAINKIKEYIIN